MDKEIEISLFTFLNDPSILGGPDVFKGDAVKQKYPSKYTTYMQKNGNIALEIFYDEKEEKYLYHARIVSENRNDVYYDALVQISTSDKSKIANPTITHYEDIKFFSNTPRFTFTFAYVYNKHDLIIPELKDKFDDITFTEPPKKTNPRMGIGYDSALFILIYFLKANSFYLRKSDIKRHGKNLSKFDVNEVANSNEVLEKRTSKNLSLISSIKNKTTEIVRNAKRAIRNIGSRVPGIIKSTPIAKLITGKNSSVKAVKKVKRIKPRGKR